RAGTTSGRRVATRRHPVLGSGFGNKFEDEFPTGEYPCLTGARVEQLDPGVHLVTAVSVFIEISVEATFVEFRTEASLPGRRPAGGNGQFEQDLVLEGAVTILAHEVRDEGLAGRVDNVLGVLTTHVHVDADVGGKGAKGHIRNG